MKKIIITISTIMFCFLLTNLFAAQVTITGANTSSNVTKTTLKAAFDAINAYSQSGKNIVIKISGNTTETATAVLNAGSWTSLKIYPSASGKIISGSITGALIDINGADKVTIDGRVNQAGSKSLTIVNTLASSISGISTIRYRNDSSNNTLKYCTIKGAAKIVNQGIIEIHTPATLGNNNITISDNDITGLSDTDRPSNAIYCYGTSTVNTSNITIQNNNIFNNFCLTTTSCGIKLGNYTSDCSIIGNNFYDSVNLTPNPSNAYYFVQISSAGNNFQVKDNYMGGSSPNCGGLPLTKIANTNNSFYPISISTGDVGISLIDNNTLKNISWGISAYSSQLAIINVNTGNVEVSNNVIGSNDGVSTLLFENASTTSTNYDIKGIQSLSSNDVNIHDNIIGGIGIKNTGTDLSPILFSGVFTSSNATNTMNINNNLITNITIENLTGNSNNYIYGIQSNVKGPISGNNIDSLSFIGDPTNNQTRIYGIYATKDNHIISNNIIHNITSNSFPSSIGSASITGIYYTNSVSNTNDIISGNHVYDLTNTTTSTCSVVGISASAQNFNLTFDSNYVGAFTLNNSTSSAYGIVPVRGLITVKNCIVSLGSGSEGNIYGIYSYDTSGASSTSVLNLLHNTVVINGTPSNPLGSRSANFYGYGFGVKNLKNNLFQNTRNTTGGTGKNVILNIESNFTALDYNDYYLGAGEENYIAQRGSGSITLLKSLTNWKSNSHQDAHTIAVNPGYLFDMSNEPSDYIPSAILLGTNLSEVTADYNNAPRSETFPSIGAFQYITSITNISFTDGQSCLINTVPGATNQLLGKFSLTPDNSGSSLTALSITLNHERTGVSNFKLWESNDDIFDINTNPNIGATITVDPGVGNSITFYDVNSLMGSSTKYFFLTADYSSDATGYIIPTIADNSAIILNGGALTSEVINSVLSVYNTQTLPVTLSSFTAGITASNTVNISWSTESETNMVGYNIYRSIDNNSENSTKINQSIIQSINNTTSNNYCFTDIETTPNTEYYYWLNAIELNSTSSNYGPIKVITKDGNPETPVIAEVTQLNGAYPNPFNPSTTISFSVAVDSKVKITVYNSKGQLVKQLVDTNYNKGHHSVVWNGQDRNNRSVGSGVYFYKMETGKYSLTKKFMLMK